MKFKVCQRPIEGDYYIAFYKSIFNKYCADAQIAKILSLSIPEYGNLIKKYGAIELFGGYIFNEKKDAQRFVRHLNTKYLVLLILSEEI